MLAMEVRSYIDNSKSDWRSRQDFSLPYLGNLRDGQDTSAPARRDCRPTAAGQEPRGRVGLHAGPQVLAHGLHTERAFRTSHANTRLPGCFNRRKKTASNRRK